MVPFSVMGLFVINCNRAFCHETSFRSIEQDRQIESDEGMKDWTRSSRSKTKTKADQRLYRDNGEENGNYYNGL